MPCKKYFEAVSVNLLSKCKLETLLLVALSFKYLPLYKKIVKIFTCTRARDMSVGKCTCAHNLHHDFNIECTEYIIQV